MPVTTVGCTQFQLSPKREFRAYGGGEEAPDGDIFPESFPKPSVATAATVSFLEKQ